jgi:hypothetical protein
MLSLLFNRAVVGRLRPKLKLLMAQTLVANNTPVPYSLNQRKDSFAYASRRYKVLVRFSLAS